MFEREMTQPLASMDELLAAALEALDCEGRKHTSIACVLRYWAKVDTASHRSLLGTVASDGCEPVPRLASQYWHRLTKEAQAEIVGELRDAFTRLNVIATSGGGHRELDASTLANATRAYAVGGDLETNRLQYPLL